MPKLPSFEPHMEFLKKDDALFPDKEVATDVSTVSTDVSIVSSNARRRHFKPTRKNPIDVDYSKAFETDFEAESVLQTNKNVKPFKPLKQRQQKPEDYSRAFETGFITACDETNFLEQDRDLKSFRPKKKESKVCENLSVFSNIFSPAGHNSEVRREASNLETTAQQLNTNCFKDSASATPEDCNQESFGKCLSKSCRKILGSAKKVKCQYKLVEVSNCSIESDISEEEEDLESTFHESRNPATDFCKSLNSLSPIFPLTPEDTELSCSQTKKGNFVKKSSAQETVFTSNSEQNSHTLVAEKEIFDISSDFNSVLNDIAIEIESDRESSILVEQKKAAKALKSLGLSVDLARDSDELRGTSKLHKNVKFEDKTSYSVLSMSIVSDDSDTNLAESKNLAKSRKKLQDEDRSYSTAALTSSHDNFSQKKKSFKKRPKTFTAHDLSIRLLTKGAIPKRSLPVNNKTVALRKRSGKENKYHQHLERPAYWVTNKLYGFLKKRLVPQYGVDYWVGNAENFVLSLADCVEKTVKCEDLKMRCRSVDNLKFEMVHLTLVRSDFEFYNFVFEYLPADFSNLAVPSILPFSEQINVLNYQPKNLFKRYF